MSLITNKQDVRDLLAQWNLTDAQIALADRLVTGWLRTASGRSDDLHDLADTDPLFSPALELLGLVLDNPTSLASKTSGPTSRTWPLASRRDAIIREVKRQAGGARGSFPDPPTWPDPVNAGPACYDPATRTVWTS